MFYRSLLALVAAAAIASPVFADDAQASANSATPAATDAAAPATQAAATDGALSTDTKINLNKATVQELMKVKGIHAAGAKAIVKYRKKHPFTAVTEIEKIKVFAKMKPEALKAIEDQLSAE
ncbi:MAG TPA: helix-hairpin-helix domain-containing protein [Gammaproteobacteria bacterium]|jgi:competence ComEA-like helix-hairpin-helix protein|nr:helix-hairpin-helix domain-containing protein [Gammaproteobacteria bacterium]